MIVDDDPDFLEVAAEVLATVGCDGRYFSNAHLAVKWLSEGRCAVLAVLDLKTIDADPVELAAKLRRAAGCDLPIVFVSSWPVSWMRVPDDVMIIRKPLERAALLEVVASQKLSRRPQPSRLRTVRAAIG